MLIHINMKEYLSKTLNRVQSPMGATDSHHKCPYSDFYRRQFINNRQRKRNREEN